MIRPLTSAQTIAALAIAAATIAGCKKKEDPMSVPVDQPVTTDAPKKDDDAIVASSVSRAVDLTRSKMSDGPEEPSEGAKLFTQWAQENLAWEDVDLKVPETTVMRVDADSRGERGKRLCETGTITEWKIDNYRNGYVGVGILARGGLELLQFIAVRSTGNLAAKSPARVCGIVTSRVDRKGADGGMGHVIQVVGLLDVPDNHKPTPAQNLADATKTGPQGTGRLPGAGSAKANASASPGGPTGRSVSSSL